MWIQVLNTENINLRYVPIDISTEMLNLAEKFIKKKYPKIETKQIQLDFEMVNFNFVERAERSKCIVSLNRAIAASIL